MHEDPDRTRVGRGGLRGAANQYRRRVEEEALVAAARLRAADRLADLLEAEVAALSPEARAALGAYREAGRGGYQPR